MRIIDSYSFYYGTKLPFAEIPERIHSFFRDQGLTCGRFMYYFEDYAHLAPSDGEGKAGFKPVTRGCRRILKDCPELGPLRIRPDRFDNHVYVYPYLTNLDGPSFPEDRLLPLMKKIQRYYGFSHTWLYWTDIDFFGETIPYAPSPRAGAGPDGDDFDPFSCWSDKVPNSGICVFRSLSTDNRITLSVDALFNGKLRDTTPYFLALRKVLPRMRSYHESIMCFTEDEQALLDSGNKKAAPVLESCRRIFAERMSPVYSFSEGEAFSGFSKRMKALAGPRDYSCQRTGNNHYRADKRTPRGAVISVELGVDTRPDPRECYPLTPWPGGWMTVSFQGLGFKHLLWDDMNLPQNKGAVTARLTDVFSVLQELENTLLPALDGCYEPAPDWFTPSDYFDPERGGYHY